jgi:hypothetical protein
LFGVIKRKVTFSFSFLIIISIYLFMILVTLILKGLGKRQKVSLLIDWVQNQSQTGQVKGQKNEGNK